MKRDRWKAPPPGRFLTRAQPAVPAPRRDSTSADRTQSALVHRTAETGHVRYSPRHEVDDVAVFRLGPKVRRAVRGETVALDPSAWWMTATEEDDGRRLECQFWYVPHGDQPPDAAADPHVRMTVEAARMTLTARMAGIARLPLTVASEAAAEAGDLERCIAWCWIESRADRPEPARLPALPCDPRTAV